MGNKVQRARGYPQKQEAASELMKRVAIKAPIKKRMEADFSPAEAEEIRQRMRKIEQGQEELERERSEAELERRKKLIQIKKTARELEKGNNSRIIMFPSYTKKKNDVDWHKMGDFSALYYAYRIATRLGRKARIMKDNDKFSKMHSVVSVCSMERLVGQMMLLNEIGGYEKTLDGIHIFHLKQPLSDEEVAVLRNTEQRRLDAMHNVLRPKQADPAVYQAILMVDRQVLPRTSKMERGYYMTIGDSMAKEIHKLTQVYFQYASGYLEGETARKTLLSLVDGLLAGVALLGEVNVWGYDVATSIGENLCHLKQLITEMK